jgi:hypothetical protein
MNYKVGDKIIISKPSQEELDKWNDSWVTGMNNYIGNEYIIEKIDHSSFYINEGDYAWPLCMLNNNKEITYEVY